MTHRFHLAFPMRGGAPEASLATARERLARHSFGGAGGIRSLEHAIFTEFAVALVA